MNKMNKQLQELARQVERQERWLVRLPWILMLSGLGCMVISMVYPKPAMVVATCMLIICGVGAKMVAPRGKPITMAASFAHAHALEKKEWLELAYSVRSAYSDNADQPASKAKLISVIEAFRAVYNARASRNEHDFYLGKLIGTGRIEGVREEVMGTVPGQIQRSIDFVNDTPVVYCSQASIFSEALINCIEKELFSVNNPLKAVLAPYKIILDDIARGNV